jgi:hypothetical protein
MKAVLNEWLMDGRCYFVPNDKWIMKEIKVERVMENRMCGSLFQFLLLLGWRNFRKRRQIRAVIWARIQVAGFLLAHKVGKREK